MVFGQTLAVNAFSRFPTFAVALEQRVGAVLGIAYVDDFNTMEVVLGEFSARKVFGWSLKPAWGRLQQTQIPDSPLHKHAV